LTLVALPTLALSLSLRPGPSVPHLPTLRHRHTPLSMIAPAPRRNPNQGTIDRLLNPLRRRVYTLLKPVSARAARTARALAHLLAHCPAAPLPAVLWWRRMPGWAVGRQGASPCLGRSWLALAPGGDRLQ